MSTTIGLGVGGLAWAGYWDTDVFTDVPAAAVTGPKSARVAIVYVSGDVGFKVALGGMLAKRFADRGVPVVAINSLGFFRKQRSVADVAGLILEATARAKALAGSDRVVLVGHSLGADVLQAALAALPPAQRTAIAEVVLIVPTKGLYLRISPQEMLDIGAPDAPTLGTLQSLDWVPVTCIYGLEEDDSPCPLLRGPNVVRVGLPGGHAMHWDVAAIAANTLHTVDKLPRKEL